MDSHLNMRTTWLRMGLGLTATLAGLDKFFNLLADWGAYVSPMAAGLLPVSVPTFMALVGVIEMAVGIAILLAAPALGAYVAGAWLLLVAGNLVLGGHFDIAVRDIVMALAALTLARLVELGYTVPSRSTARDARSRVTTA